MLIEPHNRSYCLIFAYPGINFSFSDQIFITTNYSIMLTLTKYSLFTLMVLFGFSCDNTDDPSLQDRLESMLEENFTNGYSTFFEGKAAGVYLTVRNANNDVFATYNLDGMYSHTHVKGASTTKSFTAAAILQLHSQGLLNIDHHITDLIPNQSIPYVPETAAY